MTDEKEVEGKGADILAALKDALYIYKCMPPIELNMITAIDPWEILAIKESIKAAIAELEKAETEVNPKGDFTCNTPNKSTQKAGFTCKSTEANRKAIKEGTIRQSLGNPLPSDPSTEEEVALELARQWNEEDVVSPPHKRNEEKKDDQ